MHEEINSLLIACRDKGMHTVSILGAKNVGPDPATSVIQPDLPVYSVAEKLPFRYSDVVILSTRDVEGAEEFRTIVDFGLSMEKSGKDFKSGKVEKFVSIKPRLSFMPPGMKISWLPPDLYKLNDYVEQCKIEAEKE
jgi:hypothetical protein